ncbi:MAG: TIGR04255 family protein [Cyanobacteria bacterium]|nr:TIGR04255 family protein [Cyanobacteriota bacterium]
MPVQEPRIHFRKPPIQAVSCSIVFEPLQLAVPHIGILWTYWHDDLPGCQEMPPYRLAGRSVLEVSNVPPLPRIRFTSEDESNRLDLQRDLFAFAWKKGGDEDEYPHFDKVYSRFRSYLADFGEFCEYNEIGEIQPIHCELRYENRIQKGSGWSKSNDLSGVLPQFDVNKARDFLPEPSALNLEWVYQLPLDSGSMFVRATTMGGDEDFVSLVLFCRGIGQNKRLEGLGDWFELAHQWIVEGFVDLTDGDVQSTHWEREV